MNKAKIINLLVNAHSKSEARRIVATGVEELLKAQRDRDMESVKRVLNSFSWKQRGELIQAGVLVSNVMATIKQHLEGE